jgi:hypothetical protein
MKAPWSWGIAFWAFCTGLMCGTLRRPLHIGEGSLGGIGNTAPSSSDVIPMGPKRFALQGIEYEFLLLSSYLTFIEANPTAVTGPVLISLGPVWGSRSGGAPAAREWQRWCSSTPQNHRPGQLAAHIPLGITWGGLVGGRGHREGRLRVLGSPSALHTTH